MFYCTEDCSSLLILSHFRFIHPDSAPIQPKSGQIKQISPHRGYISIFFLGLTRTTFFVDVATHPSVFLEGECKCGQPPSAQIFTDLPQIDYILVIFSASAESPPRSSVSGSDLYISDMPDLIPRSIHRKSVAFRSFTWNRQLPLMRARSQISQIFFHNRIYINLFRQIWTLRCT